MMAFPPYLHTLISVISDKAMLTLLPCQCKQEKPGDPGSGSPGSVTLQVKHESSPAGSPLDSLLSLPQEWTHLYFCHFGGTGSALRFARGHNHTGWFPDGTSDLLHADVGAAVRSMCEDTSVRRARQARGCRSLTCVNNHMLKRQA